MSALDRTQARRILEGLLFVSGQPVPVKRLREVLTDFDTAAIRELIAELRQRYLDGRHAIQLQEVAGGFQLVTDSQLAPWMKRGFQLPGLDTLSKAALETIAIIAYRQPLTKAEIEAIRGVDVSGTLDTLLERQFVRVVGRKETPGRPLLYGSTTEFLRHFGLKSLEELPPMTHGALASILPEGERQAVPIVPLPQESPSGEPRTVAQADRSG